MIRQSLSGTRKNVAVTTWQLEYHKGAYDFSDDLQLIYGAQNIRDSKSATRI